MQTDTPESGMRVKISQIHNIALARIFSWSIPPDSVLFLCMAEGADCKKADENIIRMHRQSRDSESSHKNNKEDANGFRQNNIWSIDTVGRKDLLYCWKPKHQIKKSSQ